MTFPFSLFFPSRYRVWKNGQHVSPPLTRSYDTLIHSPYLDTLPSPDKLRTPLHFTDHEIDALRGTNLHGATIDRRRDWKVEWERCHADVSGVNEEWGRALTWYVSLSSLSTVFRPIPSTRCCCTRTRRERFLTAATYLSSRAFPSTLLSPSPSLVQQHDSYPVLIPGVDALNHARAQPVSWVVTCPPTSSSSPPTVNSPQAGISLVTHTASKVGAEIFNNYGAKPNSELLLGYGFTLSANPDDTIVLKIGGLGGSSGTTAQHEVSRGGRGATAVWDAIMEAVKKAQGDEEDEDEEETPEWQLVLDCADMLRSMTESLLARLPGGFVSGSEEAGALRGDVVEMIGHYVSGQREVLQDLLQYANDREMGGVELARRGGVVIQVEGGGEDDEDEDD